MTDEKTPDDQIVPKFRELMNALARTLDELFNGKDLDTTGRGTGFILMVFPLEDHGGKCNYISNARREDVVIRLKELVSRFEGMPEQSGHA